MTAPIPQPPEAPQPDITINLRAADRRAVVEALHRAADWTANDIDCDECDPGAGCDTHAGDLADIHRWRRLARQISTADSWPNAEPAALPDNERQQVMEDLTCTPFHLACGTHSPTSST